MSKALILTKNYLLSKVCGWFNIGVIQFNPNLVKLIKSLKKRGMLLTYVEAEQIYSLVQATNHLNESMAEVGVYRGASAKLIMEAERTNVYMVLKKSLLFRKTERRKLFLYDTFAGLPEAGPLDIVPRMGKFKEGMFECSADSVMEFLSGYSNFKDYRIRRGVFPVSAEGEESIKFSFVHLDCDLYESVKAGMEFFYPRMVPQGIILSHDFKTCPGVIQAITEFMDGKPESIIELSGNQCIVVKQ